MVEETAGSSSTTSSSCERGTVGCTCYPNGTCDAGLSCDAGLCAALGATTAVDSTSTTGEPSDSSDSSSSSSAGGTSTGTTSTDTSATDESSTGVAPAAHVLFTTSTGYTGLAVGGLAGADEICTTLGQGVRAGPWVAVLRDAVTSLQFRVSVQGDVVNTLGELLATDEAELLSGTVQHAPGYDEDGAPVTNQHLVWTGSSADDCVGWSTDEVTFLGAVGLPMDLERWLDNDVPLPCSAAPRLYCLSQ